MSCPRCGGPVFKWERLCLSCDSDSEYRWAYLDLWSSVAQTFFGRQAQQREQARRYVTPMVKALAYGR